MAEDKKGKKLPKGITQRLDGRYMARFEYKGEKFSIYDRELRILIKKFADLKYEVEHGLYAKIEKITVDSWFRTWMDEYKINSVKAGTIRSYEDCYTYYISPYLGKKRLIDVRAEQIQNLYNRLLKDGYSKSTIELVNVILNSMYKQAFKNDIVPKNPVSATTLPRKKEEIPHRVLSVPEQETFLKYAEKSKYYYIYLIALFTGMRIGEIRALDWSDIDYNSQTISIRYTMKYDKEKGYFKDDPKSISSKRNIPMIDGVIQIFKKHKLEQNTHKLMMGSKWTPIPNMDKLVFTTAEGRPLCSSNVAKDIERIVGRINRDRNKKAVKQGRAPELFEHMYPHSLRHTFATRGMENGIEPKVMQEILGHSTLAMTMDLYTHVLPDTKANQINKISKLYQRMSH